MTSFKDLDQNFAKMAFRKGFVKAHAYMIVKVIILVDDHPKFIADELLTYIKDNEDMEYEFHQIFYEQCKGAEAYHFFASKAIYCISELARNTELDEEKFNELVEYTINFNALNKLT